LSKVVIKGIPDTYLVENTPGTAVAEDILEGETAYVDGAQMVGTMTNRSNTSYSIDGIDSVEVNISAGYYNGSGKITFDDSKIVELLRSI
jgi:hypothetical protein